MADYVLQEEIEGVATISLNRPDKLNAFCEPMHAQFLDALVQAAQNNAVRCILLTGKGRGFCAGQDLEERGMQTQEGGAPDLGDTLDRLYNPIIRQIRELPKPVICAVNGVAAGAGANIALSCDIILAAKSAKFIQAFAKLGLIPDSGGTWLLPHLIGEARAKALALTAAPLTAEQAADWGLIWKAVDDTLLLDEAHALARQFATGPTIGYGLIKQAIQAAAHNGLDAHLDLERDLQRQAGQTADYAEGVDAFLNKRAPAFKGCSQ